MKRTQILSIESAIHKRWSDENYHIASIDESKPKFFATFPYPYMNGRLHLGHAFTMCKVDFTCRFKRLEGHNVLFPFGFHCTGMPICAAAKKLETELATIENLDSNPDITLQNNILKLFKVPTEEIGEFVNPVKWIKYFPEKGVQDIDDFGVHVDLSRSFITTDLNPFYDSFIRWQFTNLEKLGYLKFGTRNSVYSPNLDIQCQDHDRSVGEGVGIGSYTLVEIDLGLINLVIPIKNIISGEKVNKFVVLINSNSKFVKLTNKITESTPKIISEYIVKNIQAQQLFDLDMFDITIIDNLKEIIDHPNIKFVDNLSLNESIKTYSFNSAECVKKVGTCIKPNPDSQIEFTELGQINLLEDIVIDRSGKECIVKPLPQWYIDYSNQDWKISTISLMDTMEIQSHIKEQLVDKINWLQEWGVSRQFGLGTRLPADQTQLIDSLSDSTIYPAFYTISNYLSKNIFGKAVNNIRPEDFTNEIWDYIFGNSDELVLTEPSSITRELIYSMKKSFEYWYPVDIRISGKDLMSNHLPMYLFNHSAIFKPKYFPKSIYCNGWTLIDGVKMSKSNGNFITIASLIGNTSVDAIRMTLADSGDDQDDANFVVANMNDNNLLKIYNFVNYFKTWNTNPSDYEIRELNLIDSIFDNLIDQQINRTIIAYSNYKFRDVLKEMFYSYNTIREKYKIFCQHLGIPMNKTIINKFNFNQLVLINPIIPHVTDYIWTELLGNPELIYKTDMVKDQIKTYEINQELVNEFDLIVDCIKSIQATLAKMAKKSKNKQINLINVSIGYNYIDEIIIKKLVESEIKIEIVLNKISENKFIIQYN